MTFVLHQSAALSEGPLLDVPLRSPKTGRVAFERFRRRDTEASPRLGLGHAETMQQKFVVQRHSSVSDVLTLIVRGAHFLEFLVVVPRPEEHLHLPENHDVLFFVDVDLE
jgi:urate oxidase